MRIVDRSTYNQPSLGQHARSNPHMGFRFDTHLYVVVRKNYCDGLTVDVPGNGLLCFNLKSHTFRILGQDVRVQPENVEVHTGG